MTRWHTHRCACGETWACHRRDCHLQAVCEACEQAQMEDWIAAYEFAAEMDTDDAPVMAQEISE